MGRVEEHNRDIMRTAGYRADEMKTFPSPLEERMIRYLDTYHIEYELQKIFYIYADDGWIIRYYIADFFIPSKNIIIEVDGKFHDNHRLHDKARTKEIQGQYPDVQVLRYTWNDLSDIDKMARMVKRIT